MQIYFAGSIAGGRKYLETYTKLVHYLQEKGHSIPTSHIIEPDVLKNNKKVTAKEIYSRDVDWLSKSAALIAEVSNPSLGVGYEICYALNLKKPVLCLYEKSVFLSRMITGNEDTNLSVQSYSTEEEWKNIVNEFLRLRE